MPAGRFLNTSRPLSTHDRTRRIPRRPDRPLDGERTRTIGERLTQTASDPIIRRLLTQTSEVPMNVPEDKLLDKRLVRRHIERGLVEQAAFDKSLADLPDISSRAAKVEIEVASVGLADVKAKDTGENE